MKSGWRQRIGRRRHLPFDRSWRRWARFGPETLPLRQTVQSADTDVVKRRATAVAGVVKYVKFARAPALVQTPGGHKWAANVIASINEHSRNAVQLRYLANQLILAEKGGVSPVVRD